MAKLERRSVLLGALGGVAVGGGAGLLAGLAARAAPESSGDVCGDSHAQSSYAQHGEDLVIKGMLSSMKVVGPSYLDIGAWDPIEHNNTYLLYKSGGRGVLVEPNPSFAARIRKARPRDVLLEVGIGASAEREADYYVMRGDGQLNTFSKEQADKLVSLHGKSILEKVVKVPLVEINGVIEKHFAGAAPDVLSLDVEGLDLAILKTLDFARFAPKIVCVETSQVGTGDVDREILDFMESKAYAVRGGSFVNTIFLARKRA